jgi:hypothetical protein
MCSRGTPRPGHQVDHLLVGGLRGLAAGHRDDGVVEDEDLDVDVLAHRVEQRRQPECVKVPSPMTHSAGVMPACAAPMAMPIDEPMHRHEWMAASGSSAPSE